MIGDIYKHREAYEKALASIMVDYGDEWKTKDADDKRRILTQRIMWYLRNKIYTTITK